MSFKIPDPDLVLFNARVVTSWSSQPEAELVAVKGDRIVWVGSNDDLSVLVRAYTRLIDCKGQTLIPGFIDSHCHMLAYSSSLLSVDCRPSKTKSIDEIKHALREGANHVPIGQWIRAYGYDEFFLKDRRHPCRTDLDQAILNRPIRLNHRSGHACVLNSEALAQVGISSLTPDPVGGRIERNPENGEPTGLLFDMDRFLDDLIPPLGEEELNRRIMIASRKLSSFGITSVQDATVSNSVERWGIFRRLKEEGYLDQRVTMMVGGEFQKEFLDQGLGYAFGDSFLNIGAVKIMLSSSTGSLNPSPEDLRAMVSLAHSSGFQVAIHAVERETIEAVADAFLFADPSTIKLGYRDRIEHCSECPTSTLEKLAKSGVVVVTQPGFLYHSGRRYVSEVSQEIQPWLYPIGSFIKAGLTVAFSSDAPVIDPNPLVGIYSAVTRLSDTYEVVGGSESISIQKAFDLYTMGGAYAAFQERDRGSIEIGKLADLVLLDEDLMEVKAERILGIQTTLTLVGGQVVWEK